LHQNEQQHAQTDKAKMMLFGFQNPTAPSKNDDKHVVEEHR